MIIVAKIYGGLGNQMFQYALGKSLSKIYDLEFKMECTSGFSNDFYERKLGLNNFNITASQVDSDFLLKKQFTKKQFKIIQSIIKYINNRFSINPFIHNLNEWNIIYEQSKYFSNLKLDTSKNNYLIGYWQSEKYFINIKEEIQNEFTLKDPLDDINKKIAEDIINCNSVCLHYRRLHGISNGIVTNAHTKTHGRISNEYYQKSINFIKNKIEDITLFVFSDDINWVKENIKFNEKVIFVDNGDDKNFIDLYLMSLCKHQIIANSSFSWWAAWLNRNPDKIVTSPSKWYVDETLNLNDTIPQNWIKL